MKDQRIVLRTAFCLKNMENRCLIKSISTQSIYRFGGNTQQSAVAENGGRLFDGSIVCFRMKYDRFQCNFFFLKPKAS